MSRGAAAIISAWGGAHKLDFLRMGDFGLRGVGDGTVKKYEGIALNETNLRLEARFRGSSRRAYVWSYEARRSRDKK